MLIHCYHPVQPPLSGHLLSGHPPLANNQNSEILVEKDGKVNLYWAATFIAADFVATRIFRHDSTCHDATPQTQIQTSASALGSFSFFKSFGRGQTETIRGQIVFLIFYLFFYIFLFWRDWTHILAESQSSVKYAFMQIFLYAMVVKTFHELQ